MSTVWGERGLRRGDPSRAAMRSTKAKAAARTGASGGAASAGWRGRDGCDSYPRPNTTRPADAEGALALTDSVQGSGAAGGRAGGSAHIGEATVVASLVFIYPDLCDAAALLHAHRHGARLGHERHGLQGRGELQARDSKKRGEGNLCAQWGRGRMSMGADGTEPETTPRMRAHELRALARRFPPRPGARLTIVLRALTKSITNRDSKIKSKSKVCRKTS